MGNWVLSKYIEITSQLKLCNSEPTEFCSFGFFQEYRNHQYIFYENTRLIFAQNLRTIPASAEEQSLKFSVKVVNKTAASDAQLAKCILLHAYSSTILLVSSCSRTNKNFIVS